MTEINASTQGGSSTKRLTKIGVFSLGKIMGGVYALFGLIFGVFFALLSMAGMLGSDSGTWFFALATGALIMIPIIYGIMGFIGGILTAFVFNLIAKWIGGLEIEIKE